MKDSKSPFVNASPEEVARVEDGYYVIQLGGDLFNHEGKMAFKKERAEEFYDTLVDGLKDMLQNGDKSEKEDAFKCLFLLRIMPLRIN